MNLLKLAILGKVDHLETADLLGGNLVLSSGEGRAGELAGSLDEGPPLDGGDRLERSARGRADLARESTGGHN